ncbi:MAG: head maturation protease, ClpP-related [Pseudomonadota bacterium]
MTHIRMRMANKGKGSFRAEANVIYLYDVIASDEEEAMWWGGIAPAEFIATLKACTGPVTLRINSPGGSVFGAQAMVVAMREYPHAITAQVDSLAASAASVIAAECASCVMVPGSMLMIHKAWGLVVGNEDDLRQTADLLAKIDTQIAGSYARRSEGEAATFLDLMRAETWFTPEEAVAAGLADSVKDENTQRPKAQWDLSAFLRAPAAAVEPEPEPVAPVATEPQPAPVAPVAQPEPEKPAADPQEARARRQRMLAARLAASPI